ncbi:ribonuclease Z [Spongiivirga citrea]|uniref:Ribonuclease Z n=1 Tax=Spongiivirga citrea TaxID=1481457 RepID=A0A6M0CJA4_9FLAO|nr:ribonuclease Z [Spongiivirga citrea]NER17662.1 ribonuclease Z [Spongiivirga citrea]
MKLIVLGCYSATPRTFNNPTSQVLEIKGNLFLIDCGEGTQVQLRKNKIKFARIKNIFISHLHGDHFYGLIGLISTFRLLGREADLTIYGPKGIKQAIILQLKLSESWTNFKLRFVELESDEPELIYEDDKVTVTTIPLTHRVYTNGFLFQEKPNERNLNIKAVEDFDISRAYYQKIKNGDDITLEDGRVIPNEQLTFDPTSPKSYAFCSDTVYKVDNVPQLNGVTVLYHESTFLDEHQHLTDKTKHSTAKEAAKIAVKADVKTLILGHYSTRYGSIDVFKDEAQTIFKNVELAEDGKVFEF